MYYAFFETEDEQFFSDLVTEFCRTYVHNIVDIYTKAKQDKTFKLDRIKLAQIMDEKCKESLNIFNCAQHLNTTNCLNAACMAGHTPVLAKNQHEVFEAIMAIVKTTYCRTHYPGEDKKVWDEIGVIFKDCSNVDAFELKTLSCETTNMDKYIEETNKLDHAEGYVYVRSSQNSKGYKKFRKGTKLPKKKIVPCDTLQTVIKR